MENSPSACLGKAGSALNAGDPARPICGRLGQDFLKDACGLVIPWRTGRWGVRRNHTSAISYLQGLHAALP